MTQREASVNEQDSERGRERGGECEEQQEMQEIREFAEMKLR